MTAGHPPTSGEPDENAEARAEPAASGRDDEPRTRRSSGGAPGFAISGEYQRMLASVTRRFENPLLAESKRIQEMMRAATRVDRLAADLARISRITQPPPLFQQITGPSMNFLKAAIGDAYAGPLAVEMSRLSRVVEDLAAATRPNPQLVVPQLQALDRITPQVLQPLQLAATASLTRAAYANTGVETWRLSLLVQADAARLIDVRPPLVTPALLDVLGARTRVAADLAERLAVSAPQGKLLAVTAQTTRAWRRYVALNPTQHRVEMSAAASTTVGGLIGGDLLLAPDDVDTEEVADDVEHRMVGPWHDGPIVARADFIATLRTIDATVVTFIEGAWDDVERDGAAAVSKIGHCIVEAIDRTLRALAPPEEVLAWLHREDRKPAKGDLDDKARPTRRARIAYALCGRPGDRRLVQSQAEALASFVTPAMEQAQALKHGPEMVTVAQARLLLMTAEALLMQLIMQ